MEADRTPANDAATPTVPALAPPATTGAEERAYLLQTVIVPLLGLSIAQERTIAAERQRAAAIIADVDAFNAKQIERDRPPARPWWKFTMGKN